MEIAPDGEVRKVQPCDIERFFDLDLEFHETL